MSLHIKENSTNFSLKLDNLDNKISYFIESHNERLENMSTNEKFITKIKISIKELEEAMNMSLNEFTYETVR